MSSLLRRLPAVHQLLERPAVRDAADHHGRTTVVEACRSELERLRQRLTRDADDDASAAIDLDALEKSILAAVDRRERDAYPAVVNATGVLLHTNLGRAPLPSTPPASLGSYLALEYDLEAGRRGQRLAPLGRRIAATCGAEAAVMVNNNAAALVLILTSLAAGREVVVSRGQLIEIGGSFRLPDVMAASGAHLVEVGCTNRTHLADYEAAVGADTGAILVAHQSNFRIVGFTTEPAVGDLAALAHRHALPLVVDQGSGCLHDLSRWGVPAEPTVSELLEAGADLVCFSGDKLLGGPQAGIVVGAEEWVDPLGRHPLYRALRPDKTALVTMDRVLRAHAAGRLEEIPLYRMLAASVAGLKRRAGTLGRRLRAEGVPVRGTATRAVLGGGTTPDESVPSYGLAVPGGQRLADLLREADPPVIARIEDDRVVLDLRTVAPEEDRTLERAVRTAYGRHADGR